MAKIFNAYNGDTGIIYNADTGERLKQVFLWCPDEDWCQAYQTGEDGLPVWDEEAGEVIEYRINCRLRVEPLDSAPAPSGPIDEPIIWPQRQSSVR